MRYAVGILLGAAVFAQAALAQEPPKSFEQTDEIERLPGELDSFVQDAIKEGLLRPAQPESAAETADSEPPAEVSAPVEADSRPPATEVSAVAPSIHSAERGISLP